MRNSLTPQAEGPPCEHHCPEQGRICIRIACVYAQVDNPCDACAANVPWAAGYHVYGSAATYADLMKCTTVYLHRSLPGPAMSRRQILDPEEAESCSYLRGFRGVNHV